MMITIPEDFACSTETREGEAGRKWIVELPRRVEVLCKEWNLVIDGPVMHGYVGLAVPVMREGEPCLLKVSWIDESSIDEAAALAVWHGQGAVQLLDMQPEQGAMLLERLDHTHSLNDVEITEAITIAGRLLRRLAIPTSLHLRSQQAMADEIYQTLPERWERYGRPMSHRLIEQARDLTRQVGTSDQDLLINYDLHYGDILAGKREPWLAVDPKVVSGEPEFGVAQLLWCRLEDIETGGGLDYQFRLLVEAAELDLERAQAWTQIRCVDYWLWGLSVGLTYDPARCEIITDWLSQILV